MRWTRYFINTLREVPADADVISQKLMMRAGLIRKVAAGIYTYLPLGLRSIHKLENIVREEMTRAGSTGSNTSDWVTAARMPPISPRNWSAIALRSSPTAVA